jgi:hypothetical protein
LAGRPECPATASRDPGGLVMKNWKTLASAAREVRRNIKYGERERSINSINRLA